MTVSGRERAFLNRCCRPARLLGSALHCRFRILGFLPLFSSKVSFAMRLLLLSTLSLFLLACSSTDASQRRASTPVASVRAAAPTDQEIAIENFANALRAFELGDAAGARRYADAAMRALSFETQENVNFPRVRLLNDLSRFYYFNLEDTDRGLVIARRSSEANRLYWSTSGSLTRAARSQRRAPPEQSQLASGPMQRPESFEVYQADTVSVAPESAGDLQSSTPEKVTELDTTGSVARNESELDSSEGSEGSATSPDAPSGRDEAAAASADPHVPTSELAGMPQSVELAEVERRVLLARVLIDINRRDVARALLADLLQVLGRPEFARSSTLVRAEELMAECSETESPPQPQEIDPLEAAAGTATQGSAHRPTGSWLDLRWARAGHRDSLRALAETLDTVSQLDSAAGGAKLLEAAAIAYAAGAYDEALDMYRRLLEDGARGFLTDHQRFQARAGMARVRHSLGWADVDSCALYEELAREARARYSAASAIVLEARARSAFFVRQERGISAYCEQLSGFLADELEQLGEDHAVVQRTRRQLAAAYVELQDYPRAVALQFSAWQSLLRSGPRAQLATDEARFELAGIFEKSGDRAAAFELLAQHPAIPDSEAATSDGSQRRATAALELQSKCRFEDALVVRREIVDLQRESVDANDPDRIHGLLELAALLRVMGRADEAIVVEAEARSVARSTVIDSAQLDARKADWLTLLQREPPRVELLPASTEEKHVYQLVAVVTDPSGLSGVSVLQDGVPRELAPDGVEWTLDALGRRGRLALIVSIPDGQDATVVSVTAQSLAGMLSEEQAIAFPYE